MPPPKIPPSKPPNAATGAARNLLDALPPTPLALALGGLAGISNANQLVAREMANLEDSAAAATEGRWPASRGATAITDCVLVEVARRSEIWRGRNEVSNSRKR